MSVDIYTKFILTVIAAALLVIAFRDLSPSSALAQLGGACGDSTYNPCYVRVEQNRYEAIQVEIKDQPVRVNVE